MARSSAGMNQSFINQMENLNEWQLAMIFIKHFKLENYETCGAVKKEVDRRIAAGTLDQSFMNGFRYYNPKTEQFEGEPNFGDLNGLFDNYKY
jgi:hypothetical protein